MPLLEWVNKGQAVESVSQVPYRLLQFRSAHGDESADNLLIQGDNLAALKALLPFYRGQVKCIFIDPPYNTQSAFEHYDDKLEHSQWLSMMYPRLVLLRELLRDDGSIWITIDDGEAHYLKVMCDEIFGRKNFVASMVWEKDKGRRSDTAISSAHDYILIYASNLEAWAPTRNLLPRSEEQVKRYRNPDGDPRGPWLQGDNGTAKTASEASRFPVTLPSGRVVRPPPSRGWSFSEETLRRAREEGRVYFGANGDGMPIIKRYLNEVQEGVVPRSWWSADESGHNQEAKRDHLNKLLVGVEPFATPKPERLMQRILHIASNPGDLVLDSFLGSGTTAATALKMGRRWIGVEVGEHAMTHCLPRLKMVLEGEQGGISEAVGWKGGGGFRFYSLGDAIFDANGGINPVVRFDPLAAYVWHFETGTAATKRFTRPLIGVHEGTAYYLLYNGVLGDRRPQGGNVLTSAVLEHLEDAYPHKGPRVIYGEMTRLGEHRLRELDITFKQIPYDVRAC